jgi:hypothetical protein
LPGSKPARLTAQLGGHGICVHAVEASANHVAQGVLVEQRRGFTLALGQRSHTRQVSRQPVRCTDEKVT